MVPAPRAKMPQPLAEEQRSHYLECNQIAPEYATSRAAPIRAADDALVAAISGPSTIIESMPQDERTWAAVLNSLSTPGVRPRVGSHEIQREDAFTATRTKWFVRFDQHADILSLLGSWLADFVDDADIIAARSEVYLSSIATVVGHAGRPMAKSLFFKKESAKKRLVDVGLIRYPDPRRPYVKVYRIELSAWYNSTVLLGYTVDKNGVRAKLSVYELEPTELVPPPRGVGDMRLDLAEADALFV